MSINFLCLRPLSLITKLNFNIIEKGPLKVAVVHLLDKLLMSFHEKLCSYQAF